MSAFEITDPIDVLRVMAEKDKQIASLQEEVEMMEGALIQIANLWAVSGDSSDLLMQASGIASNALLSKK